MTFLTKLTAFCALAFFLTSLGLSFVGLKTSVTAGLEATPPAAAPAPAAPAAPATPEAAPAAPAEAKKTEGDLAPIPAEVEKAPAQKQETQQK